MIGENFASRPVRAIIPRVLLIRLIVNRWVRATGRVPRRLAFARLIWIERVGMALRSTGGWVAFDLETTGLTPGVDRIVEIGAVRFSGSGAILGTFERFVNPLQPSGAVALSIHGISDEFLATAPDAREVLTAFVEWLGDPTTTTLLAHHAAIDAGFLGAELIRVGLPLPEHDVVDTLAWSRRRWPDFGNHRLDSLARRFGLDDGASHRALADSLRVRQVFLALQAAELESERPPLAYPIFNGAGPPPVPVGWADVARAIDRGGVIRIEYLGGSRGPGPREVTPQRFAHRGGVAYLVAFCHLDQKNKEFQVDRVRSCQLVSAVE